MKRVLLSIDRLSTVVGQIFAFLIVGLTAMITWEVLSRKFFDSPHAWTFDAQLQSLLRGVLDLKAIVFFLSVIFFSLLLSHRTVEAQRWA